MIIKKTNTSTCGNTIVGIVTPEWYYSDRTRIFSDVDLNWDRLEKFDLVHNMAKNLYRIDADTLPDGEFEKSFSSWYQSYHQLPRTKWGIHIRYDSWV